MTDREPSRVCLAHMPSEAHSRVRLTGSGWPSSANQPRYRSATSAACRHTGQPGRVSRSAGSPSASTDGPGEPVRGRLRRRLLPLYEPRPPGVGVRVHEGLDQFGALFGPLLVALVLAASQHDYQLAFAALAVPAVITVSLVLVARRFYPRPHDLSAGPPEVTSAGLPRAFWIYLAGAALVAAGFADFPLITFHLQRAGAVSAPVVPVFYAAAMAVSGTGSLIFGRYFDRAGIGVLVPLTVVTAAYAPLVFLGGFWAGLAGVALWGLGMGVHESIIPAAVAPMVSRDHASDPHETRGSASDRHLRIHPLRARSTDQVAGS
jgi:hypothetical protein